MAEKTKQTREGIAQRVHTLAEEVLGPLPYYLVDVEVRGHYGTRVIEVYVDGSQEDAGLDRLAEISRELDFLMEIEETVDGSYKLEVSSPGLDRPLRRPQQFQKNVGREMRVKFIREGKREKVEGKLTGASDTDIEVQRSSGDTARITYDDIEEAKIKLPW